MSRGASPKDRCGPLVEAFQLPDHQGRDAMRVLGLALVALLMAVGGAQAQAGDPCRRPEVLGAGALQYVNASVGKPNGAPATVTRLSGPVSLDPIQLSSIGIRLPQTSTSSISCHVTLHLAAGADESGIMNVWNPGEYAPLQFWWMADKDIAAQRAKVDGLRTRKNLYVKPDLVTPEIQVCVGRETALGAGEDFPGQLWAACADKLRQLPQAGVPQAVVESPKDEAPRMNQTVDLQRDIIRCHSANDSAACSREDAVMKGEMLPDNFFCDTGHPDNPLAAQACERLRQDRTSLR